MSLFFLSACAEPTAIPMMPAPVIYQGPAVDPYSHLAPEEKTTSIAVFYATNRSPQLSAESTHYGNGMSDLLHLGKAHVRFGDDKTGWEDLHFASTNASSPAIDITLTKTIEIAAISPEGLHRISPATAPSLIDFTNSINHELAKARDKEIIIYVHGAKGSFLKSVILTAEIDHFAGRDFIGVAFSWPSHQNISSYVLGIDGQRAMHSTASFRTLIQLLAEHTDAKKINVICYSAGARLVSKALHEIYQDSPVPDPEQLQDTFKLGTVLFTGADVPIDTFLQRLPAISALSQQVVVTISDADDVLRLAGLIMGGKNRIGTREAEEQEMEFIGNKKISNFEIVDFSFGKERRGFDITGHHYWHRHPWASSDIIFLLRTDLKAKHRGLTPSEMDDAWYLSEEYPMEVQEAAKKEFHGEW